MITVDHLTKALIELTDTLVEDLDPVEVLQLLTTRTALLSQSLWAGVLLPGPEGQLQLVPGSTESAAIRELLALERMKGPWLDCFRTGTPVVNIDLTQAGDRPPALASRADRAGLRSVSAFPLRAGQDVIGALTLVSGEPEHLDPRDGRILQALTDVATISLLHHRGPGRPHDGLLTAAHLRSSLTTRITSEQATGVLAETRRVSVEAAADHIRRRTDPTPRHRDQAAQPNPGNLGNPGNLADPDLKDTADPRTLLTPAEVAAMFRVDPKTITRWARSGQLTSVRTLGGHRRYRHGEVTRLLTQH